ncbi:hypothetical protein G9A89_007736 [Geosiphon pyriformis]|nr:hypothetical protein G9A89_007736 [Geosiphon pyriformis]
MTYLKKFNKLLRRIHQLETNDYYSDAQILDQFIAGLKNKLIKKVHSHSPKDLVTAIQHAKNYEMAIEEANHTKFDTGNEIAGNCKETNKTGVINVTFHYNNLTTNPYYQLITHQDHKIKTQQYQQSLPIQQYQIQFTQQY